MAFYPPEASGNPSLTRAREALESGKAQVWSDPESGQINSGGRGTQSAGGSLYVPLIWHSEPLGVLCLESRLADSFPAHDIPIYELLAFQLATIRAHEVAMAACQARDDILDNFGRLVSRPVGAEVRAHQGVLEPRMQREELAVLFSDIRGFTRMAAAMSPEQVTQMIRDYLTPLTAVIEDSGGIVDKFLGDGIMALFPRSGDEGEAGHAMRAVAAGLAMQQEAAAVSRRRSSAGLTPGDIGIGVHCGRALVG
ncbi:MAG: hypothetical protein FJ315_06175, partial [SAR202 cluster bacterium]|nr:hypothetical protein [SAR202 cluster bacterium]